MKHTLTSILLILALLIPLTAAKTAPLLDFAERQYDFGQITDDHEPVVHEYTFVNTSKETVAVLSVSTGCGCTRPQYPIEPVKAGKTGTIKITFLPAGQRGEINKDIRVRYRGATAKKSETVTLRLRGHVTPVKK